MRTISLVLATAALLMLTPVHARAQNRALNYENRVLTNLTGRYVFGQISGSAKDKYMLDTQTGRLWLLINWDTTNQQLVPIMYQTIDGKPYHEPPK